MLRRYAVLRWFLRRIPALPSVLILGLILGWALLFVPAASAGVLNLEWEAPEGKTDGSAPLTDLASYRVYFNTSVSPCGGPFFQEVVSADPKPSPMEIVAFSLGGLLVGTDYFVEVTAVDLDGNESACSNQDSGLAKADASASLTVRTLAGTEIFIGGNYGYPGTSPPNCPRPCIVPPTGELVIDNLPSGTLVLRIRLAGFLDSYRTVDLIPDDNDLDIDPVPFDPSVPLASVPTPLMRLIDAGDLPTRVPILEEIQGGGGGSAPFVVDWGNNGRKDLLVAGKDGGVQLFRNMGSDAGPLFTAAEAIQAGGVSLEVAGPAFVSVADWNNDGGKDLVVGDGNGLVHFFRNILADFEPVLDAGVPIQAGGSNIQVTGPAAPVVVDWNNDGKKDLLVGDGDGNVWFFRNTDTDAVPVLADGERIAEVTVVENARPFVVDWDQDGRKDIIVGDVNGEIYVFLNSGTDDEPKFSSGFRLEAGGIPIDVGSEAAPFVVDWNNNGFRDLLIGSNDGEVFLVSGTAPSLPSNSGSSGNAGGGGGGGGGCFIATAAYGSVLAPQVHLLREFRDRFLVAHRPGRTFIELYYTLSPPLADVVASSDILRAVVRAGLVPIIAWVALALWSPSLGMGISLMTLAFGAWLALKLARRRRRPVRRALALWACVLFALVPAALLGAVDKGRPEAEGRVEFIGEVRLPQAAWFAVLRDEKSGHVGLYKSGEAVFAGKEPLPVGTVVEVNDHALVIAVPNGQAVEIAKGSRLPGLREIIFVRSVLIDTLRYQARSGVPATGGGEYSVVDISDRRAILERDATPGQGPSSGGPVVARKAPQGRRGAGFPDRLSSLRDGATPAEVVDHLPLAEVERDTWEVPGKEVKQLGNHMGPLLLETLRSATPTFTMEGGVGLGLDTSMGSGVLDKRGFSIDYMKLASRTGLEVGDRILFVNGQPVNSAGGLFRIYRQLQSDSSLSEVKVVINRNNQLRTLTYRLR